MQAIGFYQQHWDDILVSIVITTIIGWILFLINRAAVRSLLRPEPRGNISAGGASDKENLRTEALVRALEKRLERDQSKGATK